MIFEYLKLNINVRDDEFNAIYPERIRNLADRHWTPVSVAKHVAEFLVDMPGTRVLDIGSGAGKFCMVGAACSRGYFTGVEQRIELAELSKKISNCYNIKNVNFIQANITTINFKDYDAFYFFNSFYENIDHTAIIDNNVLIDTQLYNLYTMYIREQFESMPVGTKVVAYWSSSIEIPPCYKLQNSYYNGILNFWEKMK